MDQDLHFPSGEPRNFYELESYIESHPHYTLEYLNVNGIARNQEAILRIKKLRVYLYAEYGCIINIGTFGWINILLFGEWTDSVFLMEYIYENNTFWNKLNTYQKLEFIAQRYDELYPFLSWPEYCTTSKRYMKWLGERNTP